MIGDCLIWFLPQICWICDEGGEVLVDEILRFETLHKDWSRFALKYRINKVLLHQNTSNRERDYRTYYSPRSREVVRNYFYTDFDAFGYKF